MGRDIHGHRTLKYGTYIMFVDADDYIEQGAIKKCVSVAERSKADFVHFEWKMSYERSNGGHEVKQFNVEPFHGKIELNGAECDELLQLNNFYSVNNLFRKSFLLDNDIKYGEGYIYEDTLFMVKSIESSGENSNHG